MSVVNHATKMINVTLLIRCMTRHILTIYRRAQYMDPSMRSDLSSTSRFVYVTIKMMCVTSVKFCLCQNMLITVLFLNYITFVVSYLIDKTLLHIVAGFIKLSDIYVITNTLLKPDVQQI